MYPEYPYDSYRDQCKTIPLTFPPQHQPGQPGLENIMSPTPISDNPGYQGSNKLLGKTAIISGGDSGIGRATAIAFAKEGANVVIPYLNETEDAMETKRQIEFYQDPRACLLIETDLRSSSSAEEVVKEILSKYPSIDVLVNNCGVQFPQKSLLDISDEQLHTTFETNFFSYFYMTRAVLPYLNKGDSIINTASVTAYAGHEELIDYSSTKGAIVSFTRSLSLSLASSGIRVNAVAPGPIWTPLIPSSFTSQEVTTFGVDTPMQRAGQPFELAPAYVYLASDDSRYMTGQVLHVNGGTIVNS